MARYIVRASGSVSTAITLAQITAGSAKPIKIIKAWANQSTVTSSQQAQIQLLLKSATATGLTSFTPLKLDPAAAAATATAGHTATGEGTDSTIYISEGFNVLNGWLYVPTPEEVITFAASAIVAIKFGAAPASATWHWGVIFEEVG